MKIEAIPEGLFERLITLAGDTFHGHRQVVGTKQEGMGDRSAVDARSRCPRKPGGESLIASGMVMNGRQAMAAEVEEIGDLVMGRQKLLA